MRKVGSNPTASTNFMTEDIKDGETVCKHDKRPFECQQCEWENSEEQQAYRTLSKNFVEKAGVYRRKDPNYQPTEEEYKAIDYLFNEWDYGYE